MTYLVSIVRISYSEPELQKEKELEVGRGTGSMTTWLAEQVGVNGQVIAVDASEEQLEIARKAAEKSGKRILNLFG